MNQELLSFSLQKQLNLLSFLGGHFEMAQGGQLPWRKGVSLLWGEGVNLSGFSTIDHIIPSRWLYSLKKENAALLSKDANSNKREKWPSEFYTNNELIELAKITGADLSLISNKTPVINTNINVNSCVQRYLQVREKSHLPKRITELKKILTDYDLVSKLSKENKNLLGFK